MVLSIGGAMLGNPPGQALVDWGANFGPLTVSGQWWRLLTCVFLHGSLLHIAFNNWTVGFLRISGTANGQNCKPKSNGFR